MSKLKDLEVENFVENLKQEIEENNFENFDIAARINKYIGILDLERIKKND